MNVKLVFNSEGRKAEPVEHPFGLVRRMSLPDRMPCVGEAVLLAGQTVGRVTWILWRLGSGTSEVHLEPHPGHESRVSRQDLLDAGWHEE